MADEGAFLIISFLLLLPTTVETHPHISFCARAGTWTKWMIFTLESMKRCCEWLNLSPFISDQAIYAQPLPPQSWLA